MPTLCSAFKLRCQTQTHQGGFLRWYLIADAYILLTSHVTRNLNLFYRIAACFEDSRNPELVVHQVATLMGQRILALL